jgi:quercetin dioxygenase-like cupin family protein
MGKREKIMKIARIYTDDFGETHFDEHEEAGVEFRNNAAYSREIGAYGLVYRETEPLGDRPALGDWHVAPCRQYVHFLRGETEIEVSDGEKRVFRAGDMFLVEDTTGKGHRNLRLHPNPELWVFVRADRETE